MIPGGRALSALEGGGINACALGADDTEVDCGADRPPLLPILRAKSMGQERRSMGADPNGPTMPLHAPHEDRTPKSAVRTLASRPASIRHGGISTWLARRKDREHGPPATQYPSIPVSFVSSAHWTRPAQSGPMNPRAGRIAWSRRAEPDQIPEVSPMRTFRLGLLLALAASLPIPAHPARAAAFRAGFATADITPPAGWRRAGGFKEAVSTGVHDPLLTKALVLAQGDVSIALVGNDLCSVPRRLPARGPALAPRRAGGGRGGHHGDPRAPHAGGAGVLGAAGRGPPGGAGRGKWGARPPRADRLPGAPGRALGRGDRPGPRR